MKARFGWRAAAATRLTTLRGGTLGTSWLERLAVAVYRDRLERPDDKSALDGAALSWLAAQQLPPALQVSGTSWRYRNVEVPGSPSHLVWDDHDGFGPYDELLERHQGLRVLGTCWGMSRVCHPKRGGHILLTRDPRSDAAGPVVYDATTQTVSCPFGATFADVHRALAGTGRALANQPGFSGLSVIGCLGAGGHGSRLVAGPLLDLVESIELQAVQAARRPEDRLVVRRGHPQLASLATHLGRLGPIMRAELATVPAFRIAETRTLRDLGSGGRDWRRELASLITAALDVQRQRPNDLHSVEIWIAPYVAAGVVTAAVGHRRFTTAPLTTDVRRPAALRFSALQALGQSLAILLAQGLKGAVPMVLRQTLLAVEAPRSVVMPSHEGLDFGAPNDNDMGAIEAAVPAHRGAEAVVAAVELLQERARSDQTYVYAPMGVRFVGRGPEDGLSPHMGREETVHLEIPTFGNERIYEGDRILPVLQRMLAARFEGRPHWGQRVYLDADELRPLWPEETLSAWRSLVRERDREGEFGSELLDAL